MNRKKIYTAPSAKVLLFAPCEELAGREWAFDSDWADGYFSFNSNRNASGVGIKGGYTYSGDDDGYTIVRGDN